MIMPDRKSMDPTAWTKVWASFDLSTRILPESISKLNESTPLKLSSIFLRLWVRCRKIGLRIGKEFLLYLCSQLSASANRPNFRLKKKPFRHPHNPFPYSNNKRFWRIRGQAAYRHRFFTETESPFIPFRFPRGLDPKKLIHRNIRHFGDKRQIGDIRKVDIVLPLADGL
jgi:hypothetical protein